MNNFNSIRCTNCNLLNFSDAVFCKRCKIPFQNAADSADSKTVNININFPVDNLNINLPQADRPQIQSNSYQPEQSQPRQIQDTESYQPQNQIGFAQWQQMNQLTNEPVFPHPQQMMTNGVFRHGNEIVVHRNAAMPERCVKCNRHISGYDGGIATQKYRWHNPFVYIALISPLIYVILASVLSQRATVEIPLCGEHLEDRKKTGKAMIGAGAFSVFAIFFLGSVGHIGFAFLLFFAALFGLTMAYEYYYKPLRVSKIENDYVYLKGINEDYLRDLPYC